MTAYHGWTGEAASRDDAGQIAGDPEGAGHQVPAGAVVVLLPQVAGKEADDLGAVPQHMGQERARPGGRNGNPLTICETVKGQTLRGHGRPNGPYPDDPLCSGDGAGPSGYSRPVTVPLVAAPRPAERSGLLGRVELPATLQAFIERRFTSAAQVEILLLLHREREGWSAATVARELRFHPDQAQQLLTELAKNGLVAHDVDIYHYAPRTAELAASVDALAEFYPSFRMAIISLIYSKPDRSIRDFSRAFRLRDED